MSRIVRSIAPWYPAVAYALGCSMVIGLFAGISHGAGSGVHGGVTVFLGWAIVRELAPARLLPGLLAPWATLAFAIPAEADLRACTAALLAARIAARTTGGAPTLLDCTLLVPLCGWVAMQPAGCPAAIVLAAVLFVEHGVRHRVAGLLALGVVLAVGSVEGTLTVRAGASGVNPAEQLLVVLLVLAALFAVARKAPELLRERADHGRAHLQGSRVRSARITAVASVGAVALWIGALGPFELAAASGAIIAVALGGAGYRPARAGDPSRVAAS